MHAVDLDLVPADENGNKAIGVGDAPLGTIVSADMTLDQLIDSLIHVRNARNGDGKIPVVFYSHFPALGKKSVCAIHNEDDHIGISDYC